MIYRTIFALFKWNSLIFVTCIFFTFFKQIQAKEISYIKYLNAPNFGQDVRVIPAADNGYYLISLDNFHLSKISACGLLEWKKKYDLSSTTARGADAIATNDGGLALLVREFSPSGFYGIVIKINPNGNITWSLSIIDTPYTEVVYNLIQDKQGNIYLYGNATLTSDNSIYNSLTKLSPGGVVQWRKLYSQGGIWGAAIQCKDNGFLLRTGNKLIKTDASGNHLWTSQIQVPMYHYNKVIEVQDGFIFNGYINNPGNADTICFYKVDPTGNMQWGGIRKTNFAGVPLDLKPKYNGNFIFLNKFEQQGKLFSGISELDKDLNLIHQSALPCEFNQEGFELKDIAFLKDSTSIIQANYLRVDPVPQLLTGFIKTAKSLEFTCDSNFNHFSTTLLPAVGQQIATLVTTRNFSATPKQVITQNVLDSSLFYCSDFPPIHLNLGSDSILCKGSLLLKNLEPEQYDSYLWSTGDTSAELVVDQNGTYVLRAYNACRDEYFTDSVLVEFKDFPQVAWVSDTSICSTTPIQLSIQIPNASYEWQDGSTSANYLVTESGSYSVKVNYFGCSQIFSCEVSDCEAFVLPNVITRNKDGINENMKPLVMKGIASAKVTIFNRWGQEVFFTSDLLNRPWEGNAYSVNCPAGVYYWILDYINYQGTSKKQHGTITLFTD